MAPIYHQAFTKLEKLLVIDSTDLTIVSDIKVSLLVNILTEEKSEKLFYQDLWDQFEEMEESALMLMGRDLSPHYRAKQSISINIHDSIETHFDLRLPAGPAGWL